MFAEHVEAELFHLLDVVDHRLVRRRRHKALGPISLIQDSVEEIRFAIQQQPGLSCLIRPHAKRSHGKITLDHIFSRLDPQVVEFRVLRAPEAGVLNGDPDFKPGGERILESFRASLDRNIDYPVRARRSFLSRITISLTDVRIFRHPQRHFNCFLFGKRRDPHMPDVGLRNCLHPHRLPDPALSVIEHAPGIKGLLAAALIAFVCVIPHEHFEFIVAGLHIIRHIEAER